MLSDSIDLLPRTKSFTIQRLKSLGVETFADLLGYFPSRYENFSIISPIGNVQQGETVTIKGTVEKTENVYTRRGFKIQKVTVADTSGKIELIWYNQPYILQILKKGSEITASGTIKQFFKQVSMMPKEYDVSGWDQPIHTGRLVPIYPETRGLSSRTIREKVWYTLQTAENLEEWLPAEILAANDLMGENEAYHTAHFPDNLEDAQKARHRLGFDEFFTIQLATQLIRKEWKKEVVGHKLQNGGEISKKMIEFQASIPFALTNAQQRATREVLEDLLKASPMNRFLQGDVGSGKTIVAAYAAYFTHLNGFQTLYMAPTEILAQQHFQTFNKLFDSLHLRIGLQTGSNKAISKKVTADNFDIMIGTHALLHSDANTEKVGLVVIDEQHRFGVAQRAVLKQKGINPHLLTMTATPIPRTVALTIYGELEMSILDEMPAGRLPIKTYLVPPEKRDNAYDWIKKHVAAGNQVFIICPLIEESETETMQTVKAATKEFDRLQKDVFPDFKLALLHGKMKPKDKEATMQIFKNKECNILVSTSVVEVGIDIPDATIMLIEGADRFGLAQLHQLRGRVGRSDKQSYCLLFSEVQEPASRSRLAFFSKNQNGLDLAEYDLKIRGPGDMFGTRQHGYRDLKIASFSDLPLIESTRKAVQQFLSKYEMRDFPVIEQRVEKFRINQIARD